MGMVHLVAVRGDSAARQRKRQHAMHERNVSTIEARCHRHRDARIADALDGLRRCLTAGR
jgi:hypothetical protein